MAITDTTLDSILTQFRDECATTATLATGSNG